MCKLYQRTPDDPWFEKMNPLTRLWLYESWCEDMAEKNEFAKSYGTFIGAFSNLEMAKAISGEGVTKIETSDEDMEGSMAMVLQDIKKPKRKVITE